MNPPETQLTVVEPPSVALMLQGALASIQSKQITAQDVDVLGKMMDLYERNEMRPFIKATRAPERRASRSKFGQNSDSTQSAKLGFQ